MGAAKSVGRGDDSGFGAGGDEPYAAALRDDGRLVLHSDDVVEEYDVGRWSRAADAVDLSLFDNVDGPVIDLGCGPGRMLVAAAGLGLPALGVDLSLDAARVARRSGAEVVVGSVFDAVPREGRWDTALLIDGNIGIGGDPAALLARARDIVRPGGSIIVETHPDEHRHRVFTATLSDTHGRTSARFPWAVVGLTPLLSYATRVGLVSHSSWVAGSRSFCRLLAV